MRDTVSELESVREAVAQLLEPFSDPKGEPHAAALWGELTSFGVGGAADAEDDLGIRELCVIAHEVGQVVAVAPLPATAALSRVLGALDADERRTVPVGRMPTLAVDADSTSADGVLCGAWAGLALVLPSSGTAPAALIDLEQPGVKRNATPSFDPRLGTCQLRFEPPALRELPLDPAIVGLALADATVVIAAEAVGAARRITELARVYAGQREQFGRLIGSFQAVQHLLAENHVLVESMWSSVLAAAARLAEPDLDAAAAERAASIAKAYVSAHARDVAHTAMQVFGGIAFTMEHPAHHYLRRVLDCATVLGDAAEHEDRLGRALLTEGHRA